jgi:hypothetical protein
VCRRCPLLLLLGFRMLETWWFLCIRRTECVHKVPIVVIAWISYVGYLVVLWIRGNECVHKVSIVVIACIIVSPDQNIALTFHSKIVFLSVYGSKIAIIMVYAVLIIRDGK